MSDLNIVDKSIANVYKLNTFKSEIVTQALFWEKIQILDSKDLWKYVLLKDGYKGWVHDFYLNSTSILDDYPTFESDNYAWYWVINTFADIVDKDFKVSFGTKIPCVLLDKKLHMINPDNSLIEINHNSVIKATKLTEIKEVLKYAKVLKGIPYLWGGKSSFGYDCSGLVQTILLMANYRFPRDCSLQVKSENLVALDYKDINCGDLVYFSLNNDVDHVGILLNKYDFMHSSGCVKVNSSDKESYIYDSKLCDSIHGYYRFKK